MNSCFWCGEETDDYELIGRTKHYVCGNPECNKELRAELRGYEEEMRERAIEDDFNAYRF